MWSRLGFITTARAFGGLLALNSITTSALGAEVAPSVAPGEDWTLPSWVTPSANGGFVHHHDSNVFLYGPTHCDIRLGWKDIEPSDGVFNFSKLKSALD